MENGPKRAIALGGGGPAAGLHIGVLEALRNAGITFDVWALSCIGAWVGIVYNQCDEGKEVEQTYEFFRDGVFRDDESYERFPINTVFGPDWFSNTRSLMKFVSDPKNYENIWLPHRAMDSFQETMSILTDRLSHREKWLKKWDEGDINQWALNHVLAVNPLVRYLTSMMYLSKIDGLSKLYYPDSNFMKKIKFDKLYRKKTDEKDKPFIFHNAWNLTQQKLVLFANQEIKAREHNGRKVEAKVYQPIDAGSLCACSALPFIEETVKIGGDTYCEGALVDTVNFWNLLEDHPYLDEIWISRIVDTQQVRKPENLHDALGNLCQLFAATVGEDDIKLFKYHVKYDPPAPGKKPWTGTIVEIQVDSKINFKWSHGNLEFGRMRGRLAAEQACKKYKEEIPKKPPNELRIIEGKIEENRCGTDPTKDFARISADALDAHGKPDAARAMRELYGVTPR
jgi:predicted acylesterase/phospholipase RssA